MVLQLINLSTPRQETMGNVEKITFHREFHSLPHSHLSPMMSVGQRHLEKNFTSSILPYDTNRVVLQHDGMNGGEYINAR